MSESAVLRARMIATQIEARGIRDQALLAALGSVPREAFLPPELEEFAYHDAPLPIAEGQTISQPYIVALMLAALQLEPTDRVLEIGTGSGYAAAVLSRMVAHVYTIERHAELARSAERKLAELGLANVSVLHGDGTLGWPAHAPYDAIVVAAGGPQVPEALLAQLAPGGRLVIPVGGERSLQELVRVTRSPAGSLVRESLGDVRFVPLIGAQGWTADGGEEAWTGRASRPRSGPATIAQLLREAAVPIEDIERDDLGPLLDRIGSARVVLIGEATHGTSEFYRLRARITKELIRRKGFGLVAIEGDWPDVARIHRYVQGVASAAHEEPVFQRFPTWMWRNHETLEFVEWLRAYNLEQASARRGVGFYGLDLYSLFTSIQSVLTYLERIDPEAANVARRRYACLTPWASDPQAYGRAAITGRYRVCEREAVAMLRDMAKRRLEYGARDGDRFLDAVQNAQLIANAEQYYRAMYYGSNESWNLRDQHMFDTLEALLAFYGTEGKAVVWAHNSHVGDARASEMGVRGQLTLGQLCRQAHGDAAALLGFGTDRGTVAAATEWGGPMEVKQVRPAHPESYERLFHDSGLAAGFLSLRAPAREEVRTELSAPRLERAIGVIYRPETELESHYFHATLPLQFDEYVWFDETCAVQPVSHGEAFGRISRS
jgi:protein-L-isoaspartate(D-aspartate) O-methyltransferase